MNTEETRALDRVLAALTAPAHPDELEGRGQALAAFREAAASPAPAVPERPARRWLPAGRLPLRVGVAALCVTLLGGGVAVATGTRLPLPGVGDESRSAAPEKGPRLAPRRAPSSASASPAPAARPTPSATPASVFAALCRRILREKKGRRWRPEPAEARGDAYAALVRAAGGPDKVHAYCLALDFRGSGPSGRPDDGRRHDDRNGQDDGRDGRDGRDGGNDRDGDRDGWNGGPRDDDRGTARPSARPDRPDRPSRPGGPRRSGQPVPR